MIKKNTPYVWVPLVAATVFFPFVEWIDPSGILLRGQVLDKQRILELLVLSASAAFLAPVALKQNSISLGDRKLQGIFWSAFFLLGLISCMLAETSSYAAMMEWAWFLLLVLITLGLGSSGATDEVKNLVCLAAVLCPVSYVTMFFLLNGDYYFNPIIPIDIQADLFGFSNVRYFSDYQTGLLFLAPYALSTFRMSRSIRSLGHVLLALFFSLSFVAGSRSVFFAHGVIHLFAFALLGQRYASFFRSQMLYWLAGWVLYLVLFNWIPFATKSAFGAIILPPRTLSFYISDRMTLWSWSLDRIYQYPWFGIGPMNFAGYANNIAAHPHNLPLQILVEWGLLPGMFGLAALTLLVAGQARGIRFDVVMNSMPVATLSTMATFGAWAIFLQSLVTGATGYPVSQIQIVTLLALAKALRHDAAGGVSLLKKMYDGMVFAALISISLGLVLLFVIPQAKTVAERNQCYFFQPWPSKHYSPRFWHQGWITGPCRAL